MNEEFNIVPDILEYLPTYSVIHRRWTGSVQDDALNEVDQFAPDAPITVNIQSVARKYYKEYGLDYKKVYILITGLAAVTGLTRKSDGDIIVWDGRQFRIQHERGWQRLLGNDTVMGVEIGDET